MGILTVLLNNKNLVIIGVLIAAIIGGLIYISVLKANLATTIAEKNTLVAELQVSQASVKSLQTSIDEQNTAVEKMKTDAETRAKLAKVELDKAHTVSAAYKKRADDLMNSQPLPNVSACDSAAALINVEILRNQK